MANKAFAFDHAQRRQNIHPVDIAAALRDRGAAECVVVNIEHDNDRRKFGRSEVEMAGAEWRKAHGFGRRFSCGNGELDARRKQRRRLDKRRLQRQARRAARVALVMSKLKTFVGAVVRQGLRRLTGRKT